VTEMARRSRDLKLGRSGSGIMSTVDWLHNPPSEYSTYIPVCMTPSTYIRVPSLGKLFPKCFVESVVGI